MSAGRPSASIRAVLLAGSIAVQLLVLGAAAYIAY